MYLGHLLRPVLATCQRRTDDDDATVTDQAGQVWLRVSVDGGPEHRISRATARGCAAELVAAALLLAQGAALVLVEAPPGSWLRGAPEGERDKTLFNYMKRLHLCGLSAEEATVLGRVFAAACRPPLPPEAVDQKVRRLWAQRAA